LKKEVASLMEALAIGAREHIALVGGGGKTTLMFALAEEVSRNEKRVITSTTTKVWHRKLCSEKVLLVGEVDWKDKTKRGLGRKNRLLGRSISTQGKLGVSLP
jgi:hypothetical protein